MKVSYKKLLPITLLGMLITPLTLAGESTRAWGSSSNVSTQLATNAGYHQLAGQTAQIISTGGDTRSINKSSTSCGVCIYNTNTGNNNTIQGNTSNSTNTGSVTSTASFTDTTTTLTVTNNSVASATAVQ